MTPTEFKTLFPEFTAVADVRVQLFIDRAVPYFDVARWDDQYADGIAYFVAHNLALATPTGTLGNGLGLTDVKIMKKVGPVTVQQSEQILLANAKDPYMKTTYGQKYSELKRLVGIGGTAV